MSDDEQERSDIDFVPCLTWVRRGVAKPEPEKVKLTKEELREIIEQTKGNLQDLEIKEEEESGDENTDPMSAQLEPANGIKLEPANGIKLEPANGIKLEPSTTETKPTPANGIRDDQDIIDEYGLDDYDNDDEDEAKNLLGFGDIAKFSDPSQDEYLDHTIPDEDEEDLQDFFIRGTDNLILVGHVQGDAATLEVYVYNDVEDALYVHHDMILPSVPLALEWLSFDPECDTKGNLVAVGTMLSQIQVWDLDIVDCLEPAFTLGIKPSKKKGIKRDAVLSLAWNQGMEHVLASGSVDQTVMLWDLNQKTVASTLKYHQEKVQALNWHPFDPHTLATGCCDKFVRVADCRSQDSYKKWRVSGEVESVKWNHFNPYLCIAATDAGTVHGIDVRKEKALWTLSAHTEEVTSVSLSSQCPGCMVTTSADKTMKVWDILNDKPEFVMEEPAKIGLIQGMAGCPDAPFVIAMGGDKRSDNFKVLDIRESPQVRQRFGRRKLENPLNFSAFGYETADQAEPAESMDADATADDLGSMSLSIDPNTASSSTKQKSGGAAAKFKNKDKKKKKKHT